MSSGGKRRGCEVDTASISDSVALIGAGAACEEIAATLAGDGFAVTSYDRVEAILSAAPEGAGACSSIVLWVEQTISRLPRLIEPLTKRFERSPLVVVCPSVQRWEVRAALSSGAAGMVLFEDLASSLGPCMRAVGVGQTCVPRDHWREIEPPVLSAREKQILGLVVMGYMNSQIAEQLFLAESTVKSHLSSAFGKLGVRSRNQAVDLIVNPERGLGMGILGLDGEPLETASAAAQ